MDLNELVGDQGREAPSEEKWSTFKERALWIAWAAAVWSALSTLTGMKLGVIVTCFPAVYMAMILRRLRNHVAIGVVTCASVIICLIGSYYILPILNGPRDAQNGLAVGIVVLFQMCACLLLTVPMIFGQLKSLVAKIFLVLITACVFYIAATFLALIVMEQVGVFE